MNIGKKKWKLIPALEQQFLDKKEYLSCPKCRAYLADIVIDKKGEQDWRPVPNVMRQLTDGRLHWTCPKCSELLGKVHWEKPTAGDCLKHVFLNRMGWKGRVITSLVMGLVAGLAAVLGGIYLSGLPIKMYFVKFPEAHLLIVYLGIPVAFVTYFFLKPCAMDNCGGYPWWVRNRNK